MVLTADIGNTTVAIGGFAGEQLRFLRRLPADTGLDGPGWQTALGALLGDLPPVRGCALASVVPELTGRVAGALAALTGAPVLTVDKNTPTGLPLGDYDAKNLGMDRVVDCVAALSRYAPPLAVFDMGTATTLSVVGADGVFQGGMILPGLSLSVKALSARAAQLPPITLSPPEGLIGTNTEQCMRYGALYGAAGAIEGIVARLEERLRPLTVVLTGGNSAYVRPLLRIPTAWEPELTHLGLRALFERTQC